MTKPGRPKGPEPSPSADRDRVKHITASVLQADREIKSLNEDRAEYFKSAKEQQIHSDALRLAIRWLKKPAHDRVLFFQCLDDLRGKLKLDDHATVLDNQLDLEDTAKQRAEAA